MPTFWKRILIAAVALVLVGWGVMRYMKIQTKKASPEEVATFYVDGAEIAVDYSRPYKKGRAIFGGLVPYGKVWRTGANEATTFTVNKDITFGKIAVKAGTYTLWTLPGPDRWEVYLNGRMYGWGVDMDGVAQRDPLADVAKVTVRPQVTDSLVEQFTIRVGTDPKALVLEWDMTRVEVPIEL